MWKKLESYAFAIALAALFISFAPASAKAQQRNTDINRQELQNFDRFLDSHPQIKSDLTRNPSLVNDSRYVQDHPELREFLASHNGVREELREYPGAFMRQERAAEGGYNGGGYNGGGRPGYRDEDQPHMEAALQHLRQAEEELSKGTQDKGGHRVRALGMIRQAQSEINSGIHYDDQHGGDRR
jgi:hypothetical protein